MAISDSSDCVINVKEITAVVHKLSAGQPLEELTEIWQGLIAYHSKDQPRTFSSTKMETPNHRKLLYGGDIGKYFIKWSGEWLMYGEWLHRPRPCYIFDREKLLVQRIRNPLLKHRLVATHDDEKYVNGTGSSNILLRQDKKPVVSLKVILALINSKAVNHWFSYHFHDVNIKPEQLRKIPIPYVSSPQQEKLVALVNRILEEKAQDAATDTSSLAQEIDELVYTLYGLTQEEIALIEAAS